jgi:hypothetical protein
LTSRCAQATGGHAQRVDALDVGGVEDARAVLPQLAGAHLDGLRGGLRERHVGAQRDVGGLGHR